MTTPHQPDGASAQLGYTRAPAPPGSQLDWASTVTAPTEFVPYTYNEAEVARITGRRRLSLASVVCGLGGVVLGVIGVFGLPIALSAITLALIARSTEHRARTLWLSGLVSGLVGVLLAAGWVVYISQIMLPLL
ncbi:hypothetical protein E3O25_09975 [Cryobacterium sp. TMT1-3]|uniref:Uncharacterized protein n=1 Tax=Cryobacterium luteum TaxID=1424661 RepID=A0A1H8C6S5_9MICO|nr:MULTISPECIES: hypothetical protein [Cryobacterium]TFB89270.1 hypothetical protein E3O10_10370 [Cryobacterium luteum]TFC27420.1 hypothetical protein E3O25_09975 [Cryobacterium sp. TMT1-3]SEM90730.1 hypothetical protein SAMN05216281_102267 [Cryobacterium luteum]